MNLGSVPEVVVHGRTGYVCRSQAEMIDAIQRTGDISRVACRTHVENHFSALRMAERYETAYRTVMEEELDHVGRGGLSSNHGVSSLGVGIVNGFPRYKTIQEVG